MLFFKGEGAPKSNEYARQIIENLALKTFRGQTPSAVFIDTLYGLYMKHRRSSSFEESLVLPLACILASPKFIYKFEQKSTSTKNLNQQELANRLSYFLWNSQPDEQLNFLAKKEQLSGQILKQQIARMFKDPRSDRFIDSFAIQWLELDKLNALTTLPGDLLYSARREPVEFFKHLLKNNLSYKNLVNSDFVVINQTLAKHYKIPGQESREFKAVPLKGKAERGGLLGQAAFMMMTSEGTRTSIVQRGSWVISKLLNSPPPPPPPNVPQLDPGKQKKKSALEMLNAHNSIAQCRSCHKRIDPLGYALESFDYLGIWRDHDRRFRVDVSGTMPDGKRSFKGLSEFKTRLREDHERTLKGFIEGLLIYSLGRPLSFNDGELVEDLVQKSRNGNDGIYSIIESIILSPTFVKK
jgi:hypothetical protein